MVKRIGLFGGSFNPIHIGHLVIAEAAWQEFGLEKVDGLNNRDLFRVGFEQGLLDDPEAWFHYLKMRNQSSHIYDAGKAAAVFASAREFQQAAQELLSRLEAKNC